MIVVVVVVVAALVGLAAVSAAAIYAYAGQRASRVAAEGRVAAALITIESYQVQLVASQDANRALVDDAAKHDADAADNTKRTFENSDADRRADLLRELLGTPIVAGDTCAAGDQACAEMPATAGAIADRSNTRRARR